MKRLFTFIISALLFSCPINAQKRVIDVTDHSPISTASIFDASGNMIGFTWSDDVLAEIPDLYSVNSKGYYGKYGKYYRGGTK